MERREFLKAIALAGVAATIKISNPLSVLAQSGQNLTTGLPYDLVAVMGGEPVEMFRRAMTEMGGMEKFVKAGQKVVVKPNIGWDKTPELAGNTNPDLVAEIIRQCFAAGAKEDICTLEKPAVLNIVDAYRVMKTNGPRGKSAADVVNPKGLFISTDIVAVDTAATKFFNQIESMPLEVVGHLAKGEELSIGTMDIDKLKVKRIRI